MAATKNINYEDFFDDLPLYYEIKMDIMCNDYDNWENGIYNGDIREAELFAKLEIYTRINNASN